MALAEMTVTGTTTAQKIIGRLAEQLAQLDQQRSEIRAEILQVVDAHPLTEVLTPMPGMGVRAAARILTEIFGKDFKDARPGSYAGNAPVTKRLWALDLSHHPPREQSSETGSVPFSFCISHRLYRLESLLRPEMNRSQTT